MTENDFPATSDQETNSPVGRQPKDRLAPAAGSGKLTLMSSLIKTLTAIATGLLTAHAAEPLAIGAKLPVVSQKNQDEVPIALADVEASGWLLVYFYPKADTPGCTKQACSLRDAFAMLTEKGLKVLGVSNDSPKSQKAFREKYQLPFDLLADEDATIVKAFGVPTTMGFAKRQAFLFKNGTLVWLDLSASTDQQAADVLKVIESNKQ
jgi:peroxiredoxin Q/BCP